MLADLKSAGHVRPMMSVGTSMGGRGAANEVMRDGLAGTMLAEHRMVQEISLLEEAWQRISTNGAVAYGRTEIEQATQEGAVDTLLIGADVLRGADEGSSWTAIAEAVEKFSGTVVQCSVDHDAGEQLMGYGGAVALQAPQILGLDARPPPTPPLPFLPLGGFVPQACGYCGGVRSEPESGGGGLSQNH